MMGISAIYTLIAWAIGVMMYSEGSIDWTKEEFQDTDQKTRKTTTLNRCLHPRNCVARLYAWTYFCGLGQNLQNLSSIYFILLKVSNTSLCYSSWQLY